MTQLTIIANLYVNPEHLAETKNQLIQLLAPTRAESGCLAYQLEQDNQDPYHFIFYERWQSDTHWQAHLQTAHFVAFASATEGCIDKTEVYQMTELTD